MCNWKEGGDARAALQAGGGALIGGLGGGGAFGAVAGGAIGAGTAAALAGKLNSLADGLSNGNGEGADPGLTAGNVAANILAGGIGGLVGGNSGAFAAANADLYNRSGDNGKGKGGTGSGFLNAIGDQIASAGRGALNFANQFAAMVTANNGQTPPSDPSPLVDANNNSRPPATGGAVVTPPMVVCAPGVGCTVTPGTATLGTPGYGPSNATLNSGDNGSAQGSNGNASNSNTSDLQNAANQPINDSGLSAAARAWDKHAGRPGGTFEPLTGSITDKNVAASEFVNQVLNDPSTTQTNLSRGGIEFRLPNGQGLRFNADGSFSGFLDPRK